MPSRQPPDKVFVPHVSVYFQVYIGNMNITSVQFPFPIQTESGLALLTESSQNISIDGGSEVTIPILMGYLPLITLHVVVKD